ncbi:hypothetical protein QE152_g33775, partial [Popillia japonica]
GGDISFRDSQLHSG